MDQIFPNLKEVSLSGKEIKIILQGDFPQHLFGNLNVFEVARDDLASFPLGLLERLHNLEILSLHVCLYEEIFSNEGYLEQHVGIKSLHLIRLNHLKYLWKQHSKLDSVLKNLESLYVSYCKNLLNLQYIEDVGSAWFR